MDATKDINLICPVNDLGYGVVASNLLAGLAARRRVALWPIGGVQPPPGLEPVVAAAQRRAQGYDPDAPCVRLYHQFDMALFAGRGRRVGYTFFELDELTTGEAHQLRALDRVGVPTRWAAGVVEAAGVDPGKVFLARPGVDRAVFRPDAPPAALPDWVTPKTAVFLAAGKWEVRKGHDFVARAFDAAFEPADDVLLVLNCYNPCLPQAHSDEWRNFFLQTKMGRAGKVHAFRDRLPTQHHLASLMAACDCGFFPARAEGWGLESAEMLAMGKAVILTDYSAHTEYLMPAGALPIGIDPADREPAYDGVFFHGRGRWARLGGPQLEQAVGHLRAVRDAKAAGTPPRAPAGEALFRDVFTWDAFAGDVLAAAEGE